MLRYIYLLLIFAVFSFLSWNYLGILFLVNTMILFWLFDFIKHQFFFKKILYTLPFFIIFNISTTFWLLQSELGYSIITYFVNSFIMTCFFIVSSYIKHKNSKFIFIIIWVFSEWILTKWDLSWPWLIFGNVLGNQWYLVQWYSYIGVYGGSIWLLLISYIFYKILMEGSSKLKISIICILLSFPFFSIAYYLTPISSNVKKENFICYIPERSSLYQSNYNKTKKMFSSLQNIKVEDSCKIIAPEVFYSINFQEITNGNLSYLFKNYLKSNNKSQFIIGSELINDSISKFNGISVIDNEEVLFRTKKKYVPITEFTPKILTYFFGNSVYLKNKNDDGIIIKEKLKTIPFVCYEILYSDFVAKNADHSNLIILLSSEDFMHGSYFAKKQYNNIVRLRAIENNRYLIKNSFEGTSLVFSAKGNIIETFSKPINMTKIPIHTQNTFYQDLVSFISPK